jgi:hypothetical protein
MGLSVTLQIDLLSCFLAVLIDKTHQIAAFDLAAEL